MRNSLGYHSTGVGEILLTKSRQNHHKEHKQNTNKQNPGLVFIEHLLCAQYCHRLFLIFPTTIRRRVIFPVTYTGKETPRGWLVYSDHSTSRWWGRNPHLGLSGPQAHAGPSTMLPQQPLANVRCFFVRMFFCLPFSKWGKNYKYIKTGPANLFELELFL